MITSTGSACGRSNPQRYAAERCDASEGVTHGEDGGHDPLLRGVGRSVEPCHTGMELVELA